MKTKLAEHTPIFANKTVGKGLAALLCTRHAFLSILSVSNLAAIVVLP